VIIYWLFDYLLVIYCVFIGYLLVVIHWWLFIGSYSLVVIYWWLFIGGNLLVVIYWWLFIGGYLLVVIYCDYLLVIIY
jgi:hypothetical protein